MSRAAFIVPLIALLPSHAQTEARIALVVGHSTYTHAGALANPKDDATDMAAALKSLGFRVIEGIDLNKVAFDRKIRDFATALTGTEAGVVFYAGHGLQVAGKNYLVPIDAELMTAGGSWGNVPQLLRSADRIGSGAVYRDVYQGFRLARTSQP